MITPKKITQFHQTIRDYARDNARIFPWRQTLNPYHILVSECMLQQTQAQRVVPKYNQFLSSFSSLEALANAPLADVIAHRSGLGFNRRAINLQRCASILVSTYSSHIPNDPATLITLPWLGIYSSHSIPIFAYNIDDVTIDINIKRVYIHYFELDPAIKPRELRAIARQCLPIGRSRDRHNALMDYGSSVANAKVTGISAPKQKPFIGSKREVRGTIIKHLSKKISLTPHDVQILFPHHDCQQIIDDLIQEWLLSMQGKFLVLGNGN